MFLGFVAGFKWGFPHCLRGPLGLSPTNCLCILLLHYKKLKNASFAQLWLTWKYEIMLVPCSSKVTETELGPMVGELAPLLPPSAPSSPLMTVGGRKPPPPLFTPQLFNLLVSNFILNHKQELVPIRRKKLIQAIPWKEVWKTDKSKGYSEEKTPVLSLVGAKMHCELSYALAVFTKNVVTRQIQLWSLHRPCGTNWTFGYFVTWKLRLSAWCSVVTNRKSVFY
jgi:hypothetical protein